jgi:Gpi18-like mannosyltransferase
MQISKSQALVPIIIAMFVMGLALRVLFLPASTIDMQVFNLKWYDYLVEHGRFSALGDEFANYTPPYLYLLSLATLTKSCLPKLTAIKLIPIAFDVLNAWLVYRIVKTQFTDGNQPALAAATFWLLPTVMVNSAFWGQADAVYTCFILLCVLFLLQEKWTAAVIAFAVSFAVKAQAVFILPLLAIFLFKKRIRWQAFLLIPLVYCAMMLPAWLAGRSVTSLAAVYLGQADTFQSLSMNAPNLYFFAPHSAYQTLAIPGFILAILLLLAWAWIYSYPEKFFSTPTNRYFAARNEAVSCDEGDCFGKNTLAMTSTKRGFSSHRAMILAALVSLAVAPFLLPKMHDRYFYPADVFSLIAAFLLPEIWFIPIAYQMISMLAYLPYLFAVNPQAVLPVAAFINTRTIACLLWKQWQTTPPTE